MEQKRLDEKQSRLYRGQKRLDYEQERPCKEEGWLDSGQDRTPVVGVLDEPYSQLTPLSE